MFDILKKKRTELDSASERMRKAAEDAGKALESLQETQREAQALLGIRSGVNIFGIMMGKWRGADKGPYKVGLFLVALFLSLFILAASATSLVMFLLLLAGLLVVMVWIGRKIDGS